MRVWWPCPTWALAVAAQEVGLGLRRLIPGQGNVAVPGALLERAANSSVGGAGARMGSVRPPARARRGRGARDGQGSALAAAALLACEVERVVGASRLAGVVGCFDECPSKLGRALLAEL